MSIQYPPITSIVTVLFDILVSLEKYGVASLSIKFKLGGDESVLSYLSLMCMNSCLHIDKSGVILSVSVNLLLTTISFYLLYYLGGIN